jgi:hypothetical protein
MMFFLGFYSPVEFVAALFEGNSSKAKPMKNQEFTLLNYGASIRPQGPQTVKNSANTRAVIEALGCRHGGRFTCPSFFCCDWQASL